MGAGLGNGRPESSRHPGHLRSTHLGTHVRESHSPHDTPAPSPYPGTRQADGRFHKRASVPVPAPPPLPTASVQSPRLATPATTAVSVVSYIRPYFPTHPRSYVSPRIGDVYSDHCIAELNNTAPSAGSLRDRRSPGSGCGTRLCQSYFLDVFIVTYEIHRS